MRETAPTPVTITGPRRTENIRRLARFKRLKERARKVVEGAIRRAREAAGVVAASVLYRLHDVADAAWRPVDAVLARRELSNLVATIPTLAAGLLVMRDGGICGLINSTPALASIWGIFYGLILAGRRYRAVKPPKHKPHRRKD
jgi:hypothetical protein